ncbi:phosphate uptake regulator, PhoU [Syntrophobotulus glycolicus DSM 8271]|uniref:Phosphate-specific transport system accessory protein PhoU n=1 Tax=Syntrophobotulus glycolicus (strain DSM 8271 / FlGlyR) TaxID=645991 RepID=F0SVM9_SYNGF|nr:phosphate signaling complex protein PhoU [Syntrophobotulus glycolicus]ADY54505.1 phosphate uptake regulator, PhoU [Syntrophobotulus glycolicus DSM 8271]
MTRNTFAKELEELHLDLINMGSLVEDSINNSLSALRNEDLELAALVIKADDIVDDYERKIEKKCLNLIARQQPLAGDLRKISTALKMITDMERIADHSSDIAKLTIKMAQENMIKTWIKPLIDIPEMAEQAKKMVKTSLDSYVKQDINMAQSLYEHDNIVDGLFIKIVQELSLIMKEHPNAVDQAVNLIFIAKYLERMADHATNIGEWVIYNVTGRHKANKENKKFLF